MTFENGPDVPNTSSDTPEPQTRHGQQSSDAKSGGKELLKQHDSPSAGRSNGEASSDDSDVADLHALLPIGAMLEPIIREGIQVQREQIAASRQLIDADKEVALAQIDAGKCVEIQREQREVSRETTKRWGICCVGLVAVAALGAGAYTHDMGAALNVLVYLAALLGLPIFAYSAGSAKSRGSDYGQIAGPSLPSTPSAPSSKSSG